MELKYIELTGVVFGFLAVIFAYRASILTWPAGIISCIAYVFFDYSRSYYASMYLQLFYIITCVIGWYEWNKINPGNEGGIRTIPKSHYAFYIPLILLSWGIVGHFFDTTTDHPKPYTDALATVLSVAGQWFLIRRYIENWFVWIMADNIYCYLYLEDTPTLIMFIGYLVFAVLGYIQWKKFQANSSV